MKLILFISALFLSLPSFALTNSTPALEDSWQSVVMLTVQVRDPDSGEPGPSYCNGSMITPRVILTAAHCAMEMSLMKIDSLNIQAGKYKYMTRPADGKIVRIGYVPYLKTQEKAQYLFLPSLLAKMQRTGFKTQIAPEEDIALIFLQQPLAVAADFPYAEVLPQSQLPSVLQHLNTSLSVLTINFWEEMSTDTKRIAPLNSVTYDSGGFLVSKSNSRVQPMDSGGAVFANVGGKAFWMAAVKGRGENLWSNWDAYCVGVGKVCKLAQSGNLPPEDQAKLCK